MKAADGLFLGACREVAAEYPDVKFDDVSLDNACLAVCHRLVFTLLWLFVAEVSDF